MRRFAFILAALALTSCGGSASRTAQLPDQPADDPFAYETGFFAVRQYISPSESCAGPAALRIRTSLDDMALQESTFRNSNQFELWETRRRQRLNLLFGFADAARQKNCTGVAEEFYQRVIEDYYQPQHADSRNRAITALAELRLQQQRRR